MNKTCPKSQYLEVDAYIMTLSNDILNESELAIASALSENLTSSKKVKQQAIGKIQAKVGDRPKRPLYYCVHELGFLPRWTRNTVRYLGDYLDHLIKYYSVEKLRDKKHEFKSLGTNLNNIKGSMPEKLHSHLEKYNKVVYVPAKHNFKVKDRKHLFTSKEVVLICFITMELAKEIIELSDLAKEYSEDKIF